MRALTPASPIAILSCFLHYHVENIAIEDILATSAKALALDNGLAEAHASRGLALCQLGNDMRKQGGIRTGNRA